ncbi:MAG: ATP-dependent DNA ligase [Pseudonocardia sp.]
MLATPGALPGGPEWMFEVEWDGLRLLADVVDRRVRLTDAAGADRTGVFPELGPVTALAPDVLLDGVVVQLADGVPSAAALARRLGGRSEAGRGEVGPATFMAFDVLRLYGVPLLDRPLAQRRATLERLPFDPSPGAAVTRSPVYADGAALLAATVARGLPGLVAKRRESIYRPGARCADWLRVPAGA